MTGIEDITAAADVYSNADKCETLATPRSLTRFLSELPQADRHVVLDALMTRDEQEVDYNRSWVDLDEDMLD